MMSVSIAGKIITILRSVMVMDRRALVAIIVLMLFTAVAPAGQRAGCCGSRNDDIARAAEIWRAAQIKLCTADYWRYPPVLRCRRDSGRLADEPAHRVSELIQLCILEHWSRTTPYPLERALRCRLRYGR